MRPEWFDYESIPYGQMWSDNHLWIPYLLKKQPFYGESHFLEVRYLFATGR